MQAEVTFAPASSLSLDALGDIFTRSFEGYFYPGTTTAAVLAARARIESLDLHHSLVMLAGGEPAGVALLGLRGDRAWCGGFGVTPPFRGRGLAHRLAAALLDRAREARARRLTLEVLTRNAPAIKAYARAGLAIARDLRIMEWRGPDAPAGGEIDQPAAAARADTPGRLLEHFAALHPAPAAWQRDLPSLLVRGKLDGLALDRAGRPAAYALLATAGDGGLRIEDLGAERAEDAAALLGALQRRAARIISVNEPADSPLMPAFETAGFAEIDRQHEMVVDL